MKPLRAVASVTLPMLLFLAVASPGEVQAQSAAKVLVAPLTTGEGVDKKFGERVAREVAKSLEDFDAIEPLEEDEVETALKRFGLEDQVLTPIQWRQLAGQLKADLVMVGSADLQGTAVHVRATFVQSRSGEELEIPDFSVGGDGGSEARDASRRIIEAFDAQVAYLKALQFCQEYLAANQFEDALRNCSQAVEMRSDAIQALYFYGRTLMGLERWEEAAPHLERVVSADAGKEEALQSLAFVHAQLGNTDRATELYRQYLDFNPDDAEVRLNIAFNLAQAGDYDAAIQILEDGLSRDDQNAAMWQYLGNVALAKATASAEGGNGGGTVQDSAAAQTALTAYRRYVDLETEAIEASIVLNAMKAYLAMGDAAGGFELSQRVKEELEATTDPVTGEGASVTTPAGNQLEVANVTDADRATFWALRSDMLAEMNRLDEAVRELGYALEIDPSYPNGYLKRGILHLQSGAPMETTLADFQRAVDAGTDADVIASQLLARGYNDHFKQGQIAQAIRMFQAGLDFAASANTRNQLNFFIGYGIYQQAVAIDESNPSEECGPAQRALQRFQQVPGFIRQAGDVQRSSQTQILEATDTYIFRQEQIVKKACRG
ncbi:MAG: tetratricopeptide repeat protein [Gemmatimonadota bacterium]|nr:MAG: tetratricopeptide repeat protein [Gemmatimonadota bacterium]